MNIVRFDATGSWVPAVDVWETTSDYRIDVDIPAVAIEDVDVSLKGGVLTISGERRQSAAAEGEARHRSERRQGHFNRRFRLPEQADAEGISATVKDGVLHVVIGKRSQHLPRRIEIAAA